ncbi:MAG: cation transporter [Verrucomicrobia bacterium]|nr:cation transporter [Verrucomicrobiota bacterium]
MNSPTAAAGSRAALSTFCINLLLAAGKILGGLFGNSFALIADGFESLLDLFTTVIVWSGLKVAARPPDGNHPYGHGKAESLASLFVGLSLIAFAALLSLNALKAILEPTPPPEIWTLPLLVLIIGIKEFQYRRLKAVSLALHSTALESDALHQRSDAVTSVAALIGIALSRYGGAFFAGADAWAALIACAFIGYNAIGVLKKSFSEVMDASVPADILEQVRTIALHQEEVLGIHKCRIRKSGLGFWMDIQLLVNGNLTVREGHRIAHAVSDELKNSALPIQDVVVHVEPDDAHPELLQSPGPIAQNPPPGAHSPPG